MVMTCCVVGCNARRDKNSNRTFHSFPMSNPKRLRKWIKRVSRQKENGEIWTPGAYSRICSDHFLPEDFTPYTTNKILCRTAIPSVFPSCYPERKKSKKSSSHHGETSNGDNQHVLSDDDLPVTFEHSYNRPVDTLQECNSPRKSSEHSSNDRPVDTQVELSTDDVHVKTEDAIGGDI